jgi:hypothetical protein
MAIARFKVGQVVRHRIDGGFYSRILHRHQATVLKWVVMEQGEVKVYRQEQLRRLTKRECGLR